MNPLISIIIPIYNVEKYLERCIESVVNQTYRNLEIILVDDGSTDSCPELCDRWLNWDERVRVIHKKNEGVGYARNAGMNLACGKYWMFLDSDDYLSLDAVQLLYDRAVSVRCPVVIGKHVDVYEDGRIDSSFCEWMRDSVLTKDEVINTFSSAHYFPILACAKLFDRRVFDKIRYSRHTCGEDMWIFPEILESCGRVATISSVVYYYYQRPNSIVHSKNDRAWTDALHATLKLGKYLYEHGGAQKCSKWIERAIDEASFLKNTRSGIGIFSQYFVRDEMRTVMKCLSLKSRIKWYSLFVPGAIRMIKKLKTYFQRRKR